MENPRRVEHQQTDRGYVPVYATGTVEQPWASYSKTDHEVWDTLYSRQRALLPAYACQEFLDGVERFGLGDGGIPRFDDLNRVLGAATGWEVVAVEGLLPDEVFFDHLAHRRFPVSWWIRRPDQLDYLSEPDLFHDLFGHVPLLLNPVFADYMQAYGKGGMKAHAIGPEALMNLTRLYWYTVEFGLIRTEAGLRIYGAGIVSSKSESIYSIDSTAPNRIGFDLARVMNTRYRIDSHQQAYFVIDDFAQLFDATAADFTPEYKRLAQGQAVAAAEVLPTDTVFHRGSREGFVSGGDN
ncbi:phenylalanine 4-monooxygenase [Xanthomonas sp. NCPPB 2632]|uniref:phenylalanine 4-monooxygenase n=1 Tax=Xanthomonas sp. NCPPB 2632 TaxID=3240912 RepID=UPI003513B1D3